MSISSQVGDAAKCTQICNDMLTKHNIYVQSINYPTVPRGEEKLRIAPTPKHTEEMVEHFASALVSVWKENEMEFVAPACDAMCECQDRCITNKVFSFDKYATKV